MRTLLGVLVLVLGTGGLGLWANGTNAPRIEKFVADHADRSLGETVHPLVLSVSGRDIQVSGIADSADEKSAILARLDKVEGRRIVTDDLTVLARATPYVMTVDKAEGGALTAEGNVPTEALRAVLSGDPGLGDAAAKLVMAAGAPAGWMDRAKAGIAALAPLQSGRLEMVDDRLKISGVALGPTEAEDALAALAGLSGGLESDITLLDDGAPPVWTLDYSAGTGAAVAGKLPNGIDLPAIAAALGLGTVQGSPVKGLLGEAGDPGFLAPIKEWMGQIETLRLEASPNGNAALAGVAADADAAGLKAALESAGFTTEVQVVTSEGANGDTRVNAASGETQRYMGGFWLSQPDIDVSLAGCQAAADQVLAGATINFVTGSAKLDPSALRSINDIARFMVRCAEEAGLKAEIGGHTDNTGNPIANVQLSQARASAVVDQLVNRGVPRTALTARGYGDMQPVADNGTDEGRAKNRRTSIIWSEQ